LNRQGLFRYGKRPWRRVVNEVVAMLLRAFLADYVVLGGGNAKYIGELPPGARLGNNRAAFRGGFRIWEKDWILADHLAGPIQPDMPEGIEARQALSGTH